MTTSELTKLVILRHQGRIVASITTLTAQDVTELRAWCAGVDSAGDHTVPVLLVHGLLEPERFGMTPGLAEELVRRAFEAERRLYVSGESG